MKRMQMKKSNNLEGLFSFFQCQSIFNVYIARLGVMI
jgi:hypothetical protein